MQARRFFFYGTLMQDCGTRMGAWIAERTLEAHGATVPGRLHAIEAATGWFPALLAGRGGERVRGSLVRLDLAPGELALLDRYEGREYRRIVLRAKPDEGAARPVQVYRWAAPLPRSARPIAGGDFIAWLAETGNRPFTQLRNGL